jgi:hypothetical protein
MKPEFIPYELALELKQLGFDDSSFGRFYTKPNCKMFNVDEKGRAYPIKNISKKLYKVGEDYVLNDGNVIVAPTYSEAFRWFREKHNYHVIIDFNQSKNNKWYYGIIQIDHNISISPDVEFESYEEAEIAALKELIKTIKDRT